MVKLTLAGPTPSGTKKVAYEEIEMGQVFWRDVRHLGMVHELLIRTDEEDSDGDFYSVRLDGTAFCFNPQDNVYPVTDNKAVTVRLGDAQ